MAAWLGFVHGALVGYAAHRLGSKWWGEADPRVIVASAHVGFYWRAGTALWWGVLLAALCARFPAAAGPLRRSLLWVIAGTTVLVALNP
ncbi:MAG: hypothetical protein EXR69_03465 [Myxococcales bacterium]|nr:hypothetical protein [Myxococcales bacterium]